MSEAEWKSHGASPVGLRTGLVIGQAVRFYVGHWRILMISAALAFVALDLVAGVVWPVFARDAVSAGVAALVTISASCYYQGMVAVAVDAWRRGERSPGVWGIVTGVPAIKLMVVDLLATVSVLAGLALVVLPGLVALALTAVVAPITVLERPTLMVAFRRSFALVRPHFWQVFSIVAVLAFLLVAVTAGAMLAAHAITGGALLGDWTGALLGNVLVAPLAAAAACFLYLELDRLTPRPATTDS
jgi:hypothetical protein